MRCLWSLDAICASRLGSIARTARSLRIPVTKFDHRRITSKRSNYHVIAAQAAAVTAPPATAFYGIKSEQQLFETLSQEVEAGRVPKLLVPAFQQLYGSYKKAVVNSGVEGADEELVASIMASILDRVLMEFVAPYTFPSFHSRILEPYNYYEFGQRYVKALIDFNNSIVGHVERFAKIQQQLDERHNVILLANHQTEADPGVWALLLERAFPQLATDVTYVAGDRVVTDALSKPFSMGRNLFCVHSKKHMDDYPELKAGKMATNRRTLVAMGQMLGEGGQLLWIAPSGGRDRKNAETGEVLPDKFDPAAVELMRQLLSRSSKPGHLYPLAMYSFYVMPPPEGTEKKVGEERRTFFTPVGMSLGEELDVDAILAGIPEDDKEARLAALAGAAHSAVLKEYQDMMKALESRENWGSVWSQPWA